MASPSRSVEFGGARPVLTLTLTLTLALTLALTRKHKYRVRALCSSKRYTRSFEGSAVVFFWTAVAVAIGIPEMTSLQAVVCFLTIPLANTIMEAISPHTFDNHFMWAVTWLLLWIIFDVIP